MLAGQLMKLKRVFKWLAVLFVLGIVLIVAFLLSLDTIMRTMVQRSIKDTTGMTAEIGQFHLGLLEPVISMKDLKLHNPPGFGDTPLIVIPEIYAEYDREALKKNNPEIHLTLLRFNLGELDIVKNEAGQTNLLALGIALPSQEALNKSPDYLKKQTNFSEFQKRGIEFDGIDKLDISIGTAKYVDMKDPSNNREQNIGIDHQIIANVKQPTDLAGLAVLIALRSGDFFSAVGGTGLLK
jgi:uncharacterized protein involved in outer membrane biogenesis